VTGRGGQWRRSSERLTVYGSFVERGRGKRALEYVDPATRSTDTNSLRMKKKSCLARTCERKEKSEERRTEGEGGVRQR
jgi:hypothetical protein